MVASSAVGCWPSASISTTTSPRAAARPAVSAASLPKLRDSCSNRSAGSRAHRPRTTSAVASLLPSSTTISSTAGASAFSAASASASTAGRASASLKAGMTQDRQRAVVARSMGLTSEAEGFFRARKARQNAVDPGLHEHSHGSGTWRACATTSSGVLACKAGMGQRRSAPQARRAAGVAAIMPNRRPAGPAASADAADRRGPGAQKARPCARQGLDRVGGAGLRRRACCSGIPS